MKNVRLPHLCCCIMLIPAPGILAQAPPPAGFAGGPAPFRLEGSSTPAILGRMGPQANANGSTTSGQMAEQAVPRNVLRFGPVGRWWDNKLVVQTIGISRDQQKKMDSIFATYKPAILVSYKAFLKAQSNLDALNENPQASRAVVFAAKDAVNTARIALQKTTSLMLLQIREQMNSEQISKLELLR